MFYIAAMLSRPIVVALCAVHLASCSEEEALRSCRRQIEQTVPMRERVLPTQKRKELDLCLSDGMSKPEFCRSAYLGENDAVRGCMSDKGYELAPIRSLADHFDAKCYKATWLVKFLSLLRTPAHPPSASAPAVGPCQFWLQPGQR